MGGRSASLLTKKQRSRIREGFDGMGEDKVRRDQQRVRERVRAGLLDFELLADYPDRQLELAVDDLSDEELRRALADAQLVAERVRLLRGYDRDDLVVRTRERAADLATEVDDAATLRRLELRTADEVRRETEREVRERLSADPWDERADGALKLAASALVVLSGFWAAEWLTPWPLLSDGGVEAVLFILVAAVMFLAVGAAALVKFAQALKHDVVPAVRTLRRDPSTAVRGAVSWVRRPGQTVRRVWEEL
ncbi:hypothetical protein [Halosimplex marinum]|uniref:hypothetical protein n=1 Tax=Halosimplex marinum TaxID=3396620 RepID=UPI003F55104D